MSEFHTQANLSQTLNAIIKEHYNAINKDTGKPLPNFVAEATQQICHNLAAVVNSSYADTQKWEKISYYSQAVVNILKKAQNQEQQKQSTNNIRGI